MHLNRPIALALSFFFLFTTGFSGYGQLGFSFDIKKPQQYEDRVLGSEKSETKKFTLTRRFTQNTFTRYNYFFNAKNKLNEVLEIAKSQHVDDYSQLLSFYNYSLDVTAQYKFHLDSVIYKSTTGIVLHDLRNDWIDNLYLLTGAAYYLSKQFDSAYLTFQFINVAFAEKEKDGYYKTIGSNLDGNQAFSISTKEKHSLPRKIFSTPPSRNDALVWLIRTLIAQSEYAEAASLIVTLKNDPAFPARLKNDLEEVQALWFYNNHSYDSAAYHLTKALGNAPTLREKARWEYLAAQLYELANQTDLAKSFYEKAISHTTDPVMEIYARLRSIRISKDGGQQYIDRNIADLQKMALRDKYAEYRDIIYYTLAQMESERGNLSAAEQYLLKSTRYNSTNPSLKNKAWIELGELAFQQKKYRQASNYYDSIQYADADLKDKEKLMARRNMLNKISTQLAIIERQDSLQRIASLPEDERKEWVRKMVRRLRKEQGLKEEPGLLVPVGNNTQPASQDLFTGNAVKGEWYFYNPSLRSKGLSEFKAKWGNRANTDNWRRASSQAFAQNQAITPVSAVSPAAPNPVLTPAVEISFDALYNNLPLTEELLKQSNDSIRTALFILGKALADEAEDCWSSVQTMEELIRRFPLHEKMEEVLFTLYYCYRKNGQQDRAASVKKLMEEQFAKSPFTTILTTGKNPANKANHPDATKAYEKIYDLFIEGNFSQAIAAKEQADALYGSTYWTPQLLYIESVYYVKQKQDDKAKETLTKIIQSFPGTPMADKAALLNDVLSRRQEIENELRNLNVVRPKEEIKKPDTSFAFVPIQKDSLVRPLSQAVVQPQAAVNNAPPKKQDSIISKPAVAPFVFNPSESQYVMVLLNKVDMVWANESKNAFHIYNRGKYYNRQFSLSITDINPDYRALLIGSFENAAAALDYLQAARAVSSTQIIPWLNSTKYSFSIISPANLESLKLLKDPEAYRQFMEKNLPGKF